MRVALSLIITLFLFSCASQKSIITETDLTGDWVVTATYEKGNKQLFQRGEKDIKKFSLVRNGNKYMVTNYGYAYSANPSYTFKNGDVNLENDKLTGIIKGASDSRDIEMYVVCTRINEDEIYGKFKITYKIDGRNINGSGRCNFKRDGDIKIKELIANINNGDLDKSDLLLMKNETLNYKYYQNKNLLMVKILENDAKTADYLIDKNIDLSLVDWYENTALTYALMKDMPDVSKKIIQRYPDLAVFKKKNNWTSLNFALVYCKDEELCMSLLTMMDDLNNITTENWNYLHYALRYNKPAIANYLIEKNIGVNAVISDQWTPFLFACRYGQLENVKKLVEHGADFRHKNKYGWNPLMLACSEDGNIEIVEYLLSIGLDPKETNNAGKTAISIAKENAPKIYRFFFE